MSLKNVFDDLGLGSCSYCDDPLEHSRNITLQRIHFFGFTAEVLVVTLMKKGFDFLVIIQLLL